MSTVWGILLSTTISNGIIKIVFLWIGWAAVLSYFFSWIKFKNIEENPLSIIGFGSSLGFVFWIGIIFWNYWTLFLKGVTQK